MCLLGGLQQNRVFIILLLKLNFFFKKPMIILECEFFFFSTVIKVLFQVKKSEVVSVRDASGGHLPSQGVGRCRGTYS